MTTVSLGQYTDPALLKASVEALSGALGCGKIVAFLPEKNSLEIRTMTIWEKICSFFRWKSTNIRLQTIQTHVYQLLKDNEHQIAQEEALYSQILKIYLSSLYPQDKQSPLLLKQKHPPSIEPPDEQQVFFSIKHPETSSEDSASSKKPIFLLTRKPYNEQRDIVSVPYHLLQKGPKDFLNHLHPVEKIDFPQLWLDTASIFDQAWATYRKKRWEKFGPINRYLDAFLERTNSLVKMIDEAEDTNLADWLKDIPDHFKSLKESANELNSILVEKRIKVVGACQASNSDPDLQPLLELMSFINPAEAQRLQHSLNESFHQTLKDFSDDPEEETMSQSSDNSSQPDMTSSDLGMSSVMSSSHKIDFVKLIGQIKALEFLEIFGVISEEDKELLPSQEPADLATYIEDSNLQAMHASIYSIEQDEFPPHIFKLFVDYFKTKTIDNSLTHENLINLIKMAVSFEQKELVETVFILLIERLDESNIEELFPFLAHLILSDLQDYIITPNQKLIGKLFLKAKQISLKRTTYFIEQVPDKDEHWVAKYIQAQCYEHGIGCDQDFQKALSLYKSLADEEKAWGQLEIGKWHQYSGGNLVTALQWYEKAAAQGNVSALYHQAVLLEKGLGGVKKDEKAALNLFQKLADQGEEIGLYGLATCFRKGTAVGKNISKALKLYHLAATKEEPRALFALGECYESGVLEEKDLEKAFAYYLQSANLGFLKSYSKLCDLYSKGIGIEKNIREGQSWLKKFTAQQTIESRAMEKYQDLLIVFNAE